MGSKTVKLSKILPVILVMMVMAVMVIMIGDVFISTGLAEVEHLFKDDFENGAGKWNFTNSHKINIHESGDKTHGKVLTLQPGGPEVYALIKDSADWNNYKLEGEILFTSYSHHYIGFVYNYNYNYSESRADMGAICVYGPRGVEIEKLRSTYVKYTEQPPADFMANVVMVNPHLDGNAHRALYPEYWVMLKEEKGIKPRTWHRFKAEVMGAAVHFYLDDMETPKITYNHLQLSSGSAGFKPRYTGSPCRLDNISAARIDKFSYNGPPQPAGRDYNPRELITQWDVAGPFAQRMNDIETNGFDPAKTYPHQGKTVKWETIKADGRGCVVTGRRMGKFSSKNFMYLHTEIEAETGKKVDIVFSSTNPGILMVNNKPVANITPSVNAWYDFMENPKHGGASIEISLNPGKNHIVVLFSGGRYAGDGFYARFTEVVE